ncbi:hypothetical protein GCK72_026164 [Caenorhabditis remanei]|uniref:Uncharacterized protein n=1 Tax=Caenorhabditis remanei TaxID=31234 RepID=A0A6A5G438_CAERE|nr:hypothetical protein GCK72_026164 [Caenorhabditis remanei]KAF1749696.1 hypothetical protein GCK72_026164 [Caenorhabditis remanei]
MMSQTSHYQLTSLWTLLKNRAKFCFIPNKECSLSLDRARFSLTVHVTDISELNIYCYKAPNHIEEMSKGFHGKCWTLIWEIMNFGTAVIMENFDSMDYLSWIS